jgi:hypothetical protein
MSSPEALEKLPGTLGLWPIEESRHSSLVDNAAIV